MIGQKLAEGVLRTPTLIFRLRLLDCALKARRLCSTGTKKSDQYHDVYFVGKSLKNDIFSFFL